MPWVQAWKCLHAASSKQHAFPVRSRGKAPSTGGDQAEEAAWRHRLVTDMLKSPMPFADSSWSGEEKFSSAHKPPHPAGGESFKDSSYQSLMSRQAEEKSRLDQSWAAAMKRCEEDSVAVCVQIAHFCRGGPGACRRAIEIQRLQEAAEKQAITERFQWYQQALRKLHEAELTDPAAARGWHYEILILGPVALWPRWPVPRDPYKQAATRVMKQEQTNDRRAPSSGWNCFRPPRVARASSSEGESSTPSLTGRF